MDVSENSGTPKSSILIIVHYKPSFLGYHYFWKHPYMTITQENQGLFPFADVLLQ